MATHALSIGASAAATPHLALVALAALNNDDAPSWTTDARAVKLLASCTALPPLHRERRQRCGNMGDQAGGYVGYRVEALEAIRLEIGDKLLLAYHWHGEDAYEPFRQWCDQPTASDAVAAVLSSSTEH